MRELTKQDLRIRTKQFALGIIQLYEKLPVAKAVVDIVGRQMLRSGTSVAANYREASRARSRADFVSKIEICTQEADETQLWLELLKEGCKVSMAQVDTLWQEADELISIFVTMSKNTKENNS